MRYTYGMAKAVEQLDQVIIRFAGDSGDGMQLTGDRFTSETAIFGNDLSTLPDFPAEIRAPAGSLPGCLGLPAPLRRPRHPHPGRCAERARGDEPGGAEDEPARPAQGRHADRRHRHLQGAQPAEGRLRGEPARGRLARRLPRARGRPHLDDGGGAEGDRGDHLARGRALEELLRARADELALQPSHRGDARLHREEVRQAAGDRAGERDRVQGRVRLRRDLRGLRRLLRGGAGEAAAGRLPPDHAGTRRSRTG